MTNQDKTQLLLIVDRSGSMGGIAADMIGGINGLFKEQAKLPGECVVDYVQFDTEYELVFEDTPVADAEAVLLPRGGTALLDAMGKAVTDLGTKLRNLDESDRPGKVLVVVVTDGYENSSREWTKSAVKSLVEQQRDKYQWEFVFLGANMDAVAEAATFGIPAGSTLTYAASAAGTGAMTTSLNTYVGTTRASKGSAVGAASFSDEDRENAVK